MASASEAESRRGALTYVGIHPHLLVVGAGSPIAVPRLAWLGARQGEFIALIREIYRGRESHVRRALKMIYVRYHRQNLPLGHSDMRVMV
jgi:hypothetical protein